MVLSAAPNDYKCENRRHHQQKNKTNSAQDTRVPKKRRLSQGIPFYQLSLSLVGHDRTESFQHPHGGEVLARDELDAAYLFFLIVEAHRRVVSRTRPWQQKDTSNREPSIRQQ